VIYEHASLRQGLVGAWCPSLRDSGYVLRDRIGQNNCPLTNMAGQANWAVAGGFLCLNLDGTNDYAKSPSLRLDGSTYRLSVTAWIRPANVNTTKAICAIGDEATGKRRLLLQRNALLEANGFVADTQTSSNVLTALAWQHIAFVWNSATVADTEIYVNGVKAASAWVTGSSTTLAAYSNTAITIGGNNSGTENWAGAIDDVRVYARSITQAEVRLLASRRGIGLVPQRQRRVPAPAILNLNVGGTWKQATPWVNVGGTWRQAYAYTRQGGVWK